MRASELLVQLDREAAETLWVHAVDLHPNERAHALFAKALHDPVTALIR